MGSNGRAITIDPVPDEDLSVFIQPESVAAAAAAEPTVTISSAGDFLPRSIVVKNLIQHHRAQIEKFDSAIDQLLDQLIINRTNRDEHRQLLKELEKEQTELAAAAASYDVVEPASAAAAAAATDSDEDDDEEESSSSIKPIATYDNAASAAFAAAAAELIKITVKHRNWAMLDEDKYEALWRRLTDVKTIKQWLRTRNPDFRGHNDREMALHMMAGSEAFWPQPTGAP
jgi:uncharacterized membrane protein YkoI